MQHPTAPALPAVPSLGAAVIVRFRPPTNHRGARWSASIRRDSKLTVRASVPFNYGDSASNGADEAARACLERFAAFCNSGHFAPSVPVAFEPRGRCSIDADAYAYFFANA